MKNLSLSTQRVFELAGVVDAIPLKDLGPVAKDIRLASGLVEDLKKATGAYAEAGDVLNKKQADLLAPYSDRYKAEHEKLSADISEQEKTDALKPLQQELTVELNKELEEKLGTELKAQEEAGKALLEVELGEEKYEKLKSLFEKFGSEYYLKKEAYLEVATALGL